MKRKIFAAICAVVLLCALAVTALAEEVSGCVSVSMSYRGEIVPGGSMTIYFVAAPGDGEYVFCGDFAGCGISLETLNAQTAQELADYAADMGIEGQTRDIDEEGYVCFEGLEFGLYLMVQETAAEGFYPAAPFLVTVPGENGEPEVDSSPKLSLQPEGTVPPTTTPPTTEPEPTDPSLPQTGQLNWPVPILAICGLLMFTAGWCMRRSARNKG